MHARHIRTVVGCKLSALEQHIITILGEHKVCFVINQFSHMTTCKYIRKFVSLACNLARTSHFLPLFNQHGSLTPPTLPPLTWKSCNSSYPPMVEYCRKDCYRTKHFDTLDVKTLWAVCCYIWRVASHAIIFFDLCNESDCCFQWFFFNTVLLETSWYSIEKITLLISLLLP